MPLILLASYPKSGNTWIRALLSNYLAEDGKPVSINALAGAGIHNRHWFDERLGLSSSAMTGDEILLHRPCFHELKAGEADSPAFAKTHEPYLFLPGGAPLFSPPSVAGAIYAVRNPLDIAVSYAHHRQTGVGRTIRHMGNPRADLAGSSTSITSSLPHPISTWSRNVSSWLDQKELPIALVSYENLHADAETVLRTAVALAGMIPDTARLARAVENSRFRRLREQEEERGFHEKQPTAPSFFRKGRIGDWRSVLSREQVRRLVDEHGPIMARLGYLDEAERFLAGG